MEITEHTDPLSLSPGSLLTQAEIALICRVQPETVKKWRSQGKGPRWIPMGRSVLYTAGDFAEWLEARRAGGGSSD